MIQHSPKQGLQRRRNIFISICMVCCRHIPADGKERGVTQQFPLCHMGKSRTQSCSIFHLIKCKVATQPAGGKHGKSSRLISSSSQHRVVTHVRLCRSYQAPGELNSGLSHHSEVISGCNVCAQNSPARKPSAFCQKQKQPRWC